MPAFRKTELIIPDQSALNDIPPKAFWRAPEPLSAPIPHKKLNLF
jgi:hypothetical protein